MKSALFIAAAVLPNMFSTAHAQLQAGAGARRLGSFTLVSSVQGGVGYTTNVFADDENASDQIWSVQGDLGLQSDWNRHELRLNANARRISYFDFPEQAIHNYSADLGGVIDVSKGLRFEAGATADKGRETRTAFEAPAATAQPVNFLTLTGFAEANAELNSLRLKLGGQVENRDYEDVLLENNTVLDQDFRDRVAYEVFGRAGLPLFPAANAFAQSKFKVVKFNTGLGGELGAASQPEREFKTYSGLVGMEMDSDGLVRGEISGGVQYGENIEDGVVLNSSTGYTVNAQLEWLATPLTTLSLNGSRSLTGTGVSGTGGALQQRVGVGLNHEFLRNLRLSAGAEYVEYDFQNIDRVEERISASAQLAYAVNSQLSIGVAYNFLDRSNTGADSQVSFSAQQVQLTTRLSF